MPGYVIRHRRHGPPKWTYEKVYSMSIDDNLEWVRWIERFVIGQTDPLKKPDPTAQSIEAYQITEALELGASLIGVEQGWRIYMSPNNVEKTAHYTAFHVGFKERPDHRNCKRAQFSGEPTKVDKYVVGSTNFVKPRPEYEIENQINRINRILTHAKIVGNEKIYSFARRRNEERVLCYPVYHLGFKHKLS